MMPSAVCVLSCVEIKPSERHRADAGNGGNLALMAWGVRNLISTQVAR